MRLEVHQREVEGIVILDVYGRLVISPEATEFRRRFTQLVEQGNTRAILNLKHVDFIDSTGLGYLVVAHSEMHDHGGALKLLNLSKRSAELLILTKLSTVFEIFDDERAAVNSFFPDREVHRFDILEFVKSQQEHKQPVGSDEGEKPEPAV